MHTIKLYGELAQYGDSFNFDVQTPHEMIKALTSQIKGLRKLIKDGYFRLVRGESADNGFEYSNIKEGDKYLFLDLSLGNKPQTLHLIPVLAGAKDGGLGKILLGAVIMVGAVIASPYTGGYSLSWAAGSGGIFAGGWMSAFSTAMFTLGAGIALTGVASFLAPSVKTGSFEKADEKPSYFISAPMNMANEGGALPVVVGEFICGTIVINASLEAVDIL